MFNDFEPEIDYGKNSYGPSLQELRIANYTRQQLWDTKNELTLAFRGNELAGEVGEACNIIKKLERERLGIRGSRATKEELADELADVIICVDLICMHLNISLAQAVKDKFNMTSDKMGFEVKL